MKKFYGIISFLAFLLIFTPLQANAAFKDVKPNQYYAPAVEWAQKNNIVSGYPDGTFRPNDQVSEEQFVKIYANYFKFQPNTVASKGEYWSNVFYRTLDHYNIQLLGTNDATFKAQPINRGAVAELLGYAQGTNRDVVEAIQFLYDTGITNGKYPQKQGLLAQYGANEFLTRGEIVAFLYRLNDKKMNTLHENVIKQKKSNLPNNTFTKKYKETFQLADDLYVGILSKPTEALELELFIGRKAVAGYTSKKGEVIDALEIGKHYNVAIEDANGNYTPYTVTVGDKTYTYHFDKFNQNELIGVYWKLNSFDGEAYFNGEKTAAQSINFSKLSLLLTNDYRQHNNLKQLNSYDVLSNVAYKYSLNMYKNNFFSHFDSKGKDVYDRVDAAGLKYRVVEKQGIVAENLGQIQDPSGLFYAHHSWINSAKHRVHLDYNYFTHYGFGFTNDKYTALFILAQY